MGRIKRESLIYVYVKSHKEMIENMGERPSKFLEDSTLQMYCYLQIPTWINKNRSMPKHVIRKMQNVRDKEKILQLASRKRQG